jgi:hypothetical protein
VLANSAYPSSSFLKILRLSQPVTHQIATPSFFRRLTDSLTRSTKAVIKLHLLRLTRVVCAEHPDRANVVTRFGLAETVEKLGKRDDAVLVRELAKEIYPSLLFGNEPPVIKPVSEQGLAEKVIAAESSGGGGKDVKGSGVGKRVLNSMRRSSSEVAVSGLSKERVRVKSTDERSTGKAQEKPKVGVSITPVKEGERPQHKRKISRSQLR